MIPSYIIYKPANYTLDDVWDYSVENWGVIRAEAYIEGLFSTIEKAASKDIIWRRLQEDIDLEAYFVKYKRHYIFFRELEEGLIGVISIIHDRRDIVSVLERETKLLN